MPLRALSPTCSFRRAAPHVNFLLQVSMHATDEKNTRSPTRLRFPPPTPLPVRRHAPSRDVGRTRRVPKGSLNFPHAQLGMQFLACSAKLCHSRAPVPGWEIVVAARTPGRREVRRAEIRRQRSRPRFDSMNLTRRSTRDRRKNGESREYLGLSRTRGGDKSATFVCHVAREDALIR